MKRFSVAGFFPLLLLAGGCVGRVGTFDVLSTREGNPDPNGPITRDSAEGTDYRGWILFIPLGSSPDISRATEDCVKKGKGDYLTNAVVEYEDFSCFLFRVQGFTVKGKVRSFGKAPPASEPQATPAKEAPVAPAGTFCTGCGRRFGEAEAYCSHCGTKRPN